jgi:tetratricopeptide (TPR) repeat protein
MKPNRFIIKFTFLILLFCGCNSPKKEATFYEHQQNIADSLYLINNYFSALEYYNKLLSIKHDPKNFYKRGMCKGQLDDFKGAIKDYQISIQDNYRKDSSCFNIGCCYGMLELDSMAIVFFKKTLELNPNMQKAKDQLYFYEYLKNKK